MSYGERQGWFTDPFELHEQRYFSAGRPTELVRDGNVEGYDEPPPLTPELADVLSAPDSFGPALAAGDLSESGGTFKYRPRRRWPAAGVLAAVAVLVIAGVVAVAARHGSAGAPRLVPLDDVAFVTSGAQRTLAERTADLTLSGSVAADGQTATLSGTGEMDFTTNAAQLTFGFAVAGHQATEEEILSGGSLYFTMTVDGSSIASLTGGRSWIQMPVKSAASASLGGSDPGSSLRLLELRGDTVRELGIKVLDGVTCTGYAVTPSRQAMMAAASKETSALGLPASAADIVRSMSPPTTTVWLDPHGLVREMSASIQLGGATGASGSVVVDLSNYGAPVHVTAPAPSDVISYQSFVSLSGSQGSL